ncbi:MAG: hypothetical protein KGS47_07560 [Chloroflexi bacterium]|nr:hypothetical protein [Chloroflexota bacterium]
MLNACIIGWSIEDDRDLFHLLDDHVVLRSIDHTASAYQYVAQSMPEFVILAIARSDTIVLRLFRQLQRVGRVCVIVVDDAQMTAYHGRNYRWSRSAPRSAQGMLTLVDWGARLLASSAAEAGRRSRT